VSSRERAAPAQDPAAGLDDSESAGSEPCVWLVLLVSADDELAVCDGLALVDADLLGDADLLAAALDVDELTAGPACCAGEFVQLPVGVGAACLVSVTGAVDVCVTVLVPVTVGLTVPVAVPLGLAVPVVLLLTAGVLWTAGGVELLDWTAGLGFFTFCETAACELAVDDGHVVPAAEPVPPEDAVVSCVPPPSTPLPELPEAEPGVELDGLEPNPTDCPIPWRIDGTVASTIPTANSAKPTAKAGRRMASRQSRGRGACRGRSGLARWVPGAVCPWRSACQPRTRAAYQRRARSARMLKTADTPPASQNLRAVA